MKVTESKHGKVVQLALEGRLDTPECPLVEAKIQSVIVEGCKDLVFDFSALNYISSSGLRLLVRYHKEFEKLGGRLFIIKVSKPIENLLYITGFLPHLKIFENLSEVLEVVNARAL